jgi:hypothetical protein
MISLPSITLLLAFDSRFFSNGSVVMLLSPYPIFT